SLKLVEARYEQ
ncbi:hypothetical protein A2U01_0107929, partial [Trifolium medium]|nr:hypothetical protein [Trifolium medium]